VILKPAWHNTRSCIDAGPVKTNLQANWPGLGGRLIRLLATLFFRDPRDGAQTVVYCAAVSDEEADHQLRGKLVVDCAGLDVDAAAVTKAYNDAEQLWTTAAALCGLQATAASGDRSGACETIKARQRLNAAGTTKCESDGGL
jgi:hypothetical protein